MFAIASVAVILAAAMMVPASYAVTFRSRVTNYASSDEPLREWLNVQPGVVKDRVFVYRYEPNKIHVTFIIVQNSWATRKCQT